MPHSFVYHGWIHKNRAHRHGVSVQRSCRQWESCSKIYQEPYPHHATPPHTLIAKVIQRLRERGTFTVNKAGFSAPGVIPVALSTLKRTYYIALKRPHQRVPEPLRKEWGCLIVPSGWFCMSSKYALTIPRWYMQWVQPILHSMWISLCGSYIVVWKSPSFHDIFFTDECRFTRNAALNSQNSHDWYDENPHGIWTTDLLVSGQVLLPLELLGYSSHPEVYLQGWTNRTEPPPHGKKKNNNNNK